MHDSLTNLWYGFSIALQPQNLQWSFFDVLVGNLVGVLPGMGALSAMAILLPLTIALHEVPAVMMLAGIFYGAIYGGAIGAILLKSTTIFIPVEFRARIRHANESVSCSTKMPGSRKTV